MSLYNMLFGKNSLTPILLATVGLKEVDIQRFRDCSVSDDGKHIEIYSRTGGGNREGYPNKRMRKNKLWESSVDDDFDCTYCTDLMKIPEEFVDDVALLPSFWENGLRKEFAAHISKTLNRKDKKRDKRRAAYEFEVSKIQRTNHTKKNGHTFVPHDDNALKTALELAEKNGGELLSCWGIIPLKLKVDQNIDKFGTLYRVKTECIWETDLDYWSHIKDVYSEKFPKTVARINIDAEKYLKRKK